MQLLRFWLLCWRRVLAGARAGTCRRLLGALVIIPAGLAPAQGAWIETNENGFAVYTGLNQASTNGLGAWIWTSTVSDKQTCRLWQAFEIPRLQVVTQARLSISGHNGYRVWLDGQEVGRGSDWHTLSFYDVTQLLHPGRHVLAVEGFNDTSLAGVILGLRVKMGGLAGGQDLRVATDQSWRVVPNTERGWQKRRYADASWPPATIVGTLGRDPWWSIPTTIVNVPPLKPVIIPFWQNGWFQLSLLAACGVVLLLWLRLATKLAIQSQARQLLQLERARIARDLHDDLGARITQLLLTGEEARAQAPVGTEENAQFDQICESARDALDGVDEVIWLVNSQRDTLNDFAIYICKHAQAFLRSTAIRCRFDIEPELPAMTLDLPVRRNLLLAVKEALGNVARHSQATALLLGIRVQESVVRVTVADDGRGFDPAQNAGPGRGLSNMARRMQELGGGCRIDSRPGAGVRIEFNVPLRRDGLRAGAASRLRFHWQRRFAQAAGLAGVLVIVVAGPARARGAGTETNEAGFTVRAVTDSTATNGLGSWIWARKTLDKQTCRLWRTFEIPRTKTVAHARLSITADNGYRVWLDGRDVGQGSDWRTLTFYDVTQLLKPGRHVLAVEGFNDSNKAGVVLGLQVTLTDGRILHIASDKNWRVVPNTENGWETRTHADAGWPAARVIGPLGTVPWGVMPRVVVNVPPLVPVTLRWWQNGWLQMLLAVVSGAVLLLWFRLATQLAIQSKAQQLLQLERARIARDLHDDLGSRITQLLLTGEEARARAPAGSNLNTQFGQICESARDALDGVDEVIWLVNSQRDTLNDFVIYICKYAPAFLRSTAIRCRFDIEPELPGLTLDLPVRRNLLLAVKEALSNVARHSEAAGVLLGIRVSEAVIVVLVEDNGRGFDRAKTDGQRHGLANMTQRMQELGGACRISSRPGAGVRIEFSVPLRRDGLRSRWFHRGMPGRTAAKPAGRPALETARTAGAD